MANTNRRKGRSLSLWRTLCSGDRICHCYIYIEFRVSSGSHTLGSIVVKLRALISSVQHTGELTWIRKTIGHKETTEKNNHLVN